MSGHLISNPCWKLLHLKALTLIGLGIWAEALTSSTTLGCSCHMHLTRLTKPCEQLRAKSVKLFSDAFVFTRFATERLKCNISHS